MIRSLVAASILWPALMAATVEARIEHRGVVWTSVVYVAASYVCHQKPERSFHTAGVQWPVCARCSGLYASAPLGAIVGLVLSARRRRQTPAAGSWSGPTALWIVGVAGVPTAVTFAIEKLGLVGPSGLARFVAALPLGLAAATVVVVAIAGSRRPIE